MRIGIFGGSFDPVHRGHLALADAAVRELRLDRLYFVPVRISPFKPEPTAAPRHRLAMLRLALRGLPRCAISDEELRRPGPSYSIDTLRAFRKRLPGAELFLVLGGDALAGFTRWKRWPELLKLCRLAAARRSGVPAPRLSGTVGGKTVWLKARIPAAASTELRSNSVGASVRVPLEVNAYIEKHRLYRTGPDDPAFIECVVFPFLKEKLPPERFRHVLGVIDFAMRLARKHGVAPDRARLAAALHDAARCWSQRELVGYAKRRRLRIPHLDFILRRQPVLLHSAIGADLARRRFGVRDREVLSAIAKHSAAGEKMSRLEKLIYVADLFAPDRKFTGAERFRRLALRDLDRAFLEGLRVKLLYLIGRGEPLHPGAARVWNRFSGHE